MCICILHVNDTIPRIFVIITCNSLNFCFPGDDVQCIKRKSVWRRFREISDKRTWPCMNLIQKQRDRKSVKSIVRNNHKKGIQDFVVYSILYSSFIQSIFSWNNIYICLASFAGLRLWYWATYVRWNNISTDYISLYSYHA